MANGKSIVFELNGSRAATELYEQLPMGIEVEDFGNNEKIFYPPKKLDVAGAPPANGGPGTLAYYAPWGDVVIFYDRFGPATGLYELGQAISGIEHIAGLNGEIRVCQGPNP